MSDHDPQAPRQRWTDPRLDDLADMVRAIAPVATTVATHAAQIDGLRDDNTEVRRWLVDVEARLVKRLDDENRAAEAFRQEYREDRRDEDRRREEDEQEAKGRRVVLIAAGIGGTIAVGTSLVTSILSLLGGS